MVAALRLFPDARFIFAQRHPCDVVLSCFMTNFQLNAATANFTDLLGTARLYDQVLSYWEQCRALLAPPVHVLSYEAMVNDPEQALRPLIGFLDLSWDDRLLDHRQTARARGYIPTASYAQVTEKIYSRASGRWIRYRDQMRDVLPILAPWAERMGYGM
jgi:hypothetical protein